MLDAFAHILITLVFGFVALVIGGPFIWGLAHSLATSANFVTPVFCVFTYSLAFCMRGALSHRHFLF
jgi:thiamine transporter ThiT